MFVVFVVVLMSPSVQFVLEGVSQLRLDLNPFVSAEYVAAVVAVGGS